MSVSDERIAMRKEEFKAGLSQNIIKEKRLMHSDKLRKNRRRETLTKMRKGNDNTSNTTGNINDNRNINDSNNKLMVQAIYADDPDAALKGLKYLRVMSSDGMIEVIWNLGIHDKVTSYLTYTDYPDHQYEALWIMTNLISGPSSIAVPIIENTPIANYAIKLLSIPVTKIRVQAIWCIANIAGESIKYRDSLLNKNIIRPILASLSHSVQYEKRVIRDIRDITWSLSNLVRGKKNIPTEKIIPILPVIKDVLKSCDDVETISNITWIICYISTHLDNNKQINLLFVMDIITPRYLQFIRVPKYRSQVMRTCGNIISGEDEVTKKLLNIGFLDYLPELLQCNSRHVQKEAMWILSNIGAGTFEQIDLLFRKGFIDYAVNVIDSSTSNIRREIAYLLCNVIIGGNDYLIDYMVSRLDVIDRIGQLININQDLYLTIQCLHSLKKIMNTDCKSISSLQKLQVFGNMSYVLNKLCMSVDDTISVLAGELLDLYIK